VRHLILAAATANPTFVSQYGPLIAALIALSGVLITLLINVRRDQERYRSEREDAYRRDQRSAIAAIAVAGHNFRRECTALLNDDEWHAHRESADTATATLLNELTVAKLLVYDADLQEGLDGVFDAWDGVCAAINRLEVERLNRKSARDDAVKSLNDKLEEFDNQSDFLHTITLKRLRPTVVKAG
jgi:hypothetical protein